MENQSGLGPYEMIHQCMNSVALKETAENHKEPRKLPWIFHTEKSPLMVYFPQMTSFSDKALDQMAGYIWLHTQLYHDKQA